MSQPEQPAVVPPPPSSSDSVPPPPPIIESGSEPASIKPLLNPLQSDAPPPSSTLVEPPKSPNPFNPATDDKGNAAGTEGMNGDAQEPEPTPIPVASSEAPAVISHTPTPAPEPISVPAEPSKSPLPPDATVPPTPRAEDEAPPTLPPDAIPPAVPTPSVITTEEQEAKGGILGVEQPALPTPGPEETAQVPEAPAAAVEGGEPMEVDMEKEVGTTPTASGLQSSQSEGSLKRAGENLDGERDEKRLREESTNVTTTIPASTPTPQPISAALPAPVSSLPAEPAPPAAAPPAGDLTQPPPAWLAYQPPAPRPSGPTTPLTQHQHKHLLNAVRSLKKKTPDVFAFLQPVDTVAFGIPHYNQIIDRPMDLGTVETKLIASDPRGPPKDQSKARKWDTSKGAYNSYSEVVEDVRQIWENTRKFNGPGHVVTVAADKLDAAFENALSKIPPEPVLAPPPAPVSATPPAATPVAGPSSARRASISQPPTIRRSSDDSRPKREIHPPPSKDLAYEETAGTARKPKRRNDPQLQWGFKVVKSLETTQKFFPAAAPFLYPVEEIIKAIPDYTKVVKKPIDLLHIKDKLEQGLYDEVNQLDSDIRLMVNNALKFNPPGDAVNTAATQLLQIWNEKWQTLPPKQDIRDSSEDPLADNYEEDGYQSEDDSKQLKSLEAQVSNLNDQIAELRAKIAKGRANRPPKSAKPKTTKAGSQQRKPSVAKHSPGVNGNGHSAAKKSKKTKEAVYRDEDEDMESEEEDTTAITLTQKQELAEKITQADEQTLQEAITIIQQTTNLGANNEEIELDIDSLPVATVAKLYNLVCRGRRGGSKPGRKSLGGASGGPGGSAKKAGKKASGGVTKRSVNEREEAERIRRMEAQLQSFDSRAGGAGQGLGSGGVGYEEGESSSEEESSDEE